MIWVEKANGDSFRLPTQKFNTVPYAITAQQAMDFEVKGDLTVDGSLSVLANQEGNSAFVRIRDVNPECNGQDPSSANARCGGLEVFERNDGNGQWGRVGIDTNEMYIRGYNGNTFSIFGPPGQLIQIGTELRINNQIKAKDYKGYEKKFIVFSSDCEEVGNGIAYDCTCPDGYTAIGGEGLGPNNGSIYESRQYRYNKWRIGGRGGLPRNARAVCLLSTDYEYE